MKKRILIVLTVDVLLAGVILAAPAVLRHMLVHFPSCWLAARGIQCPACGGTRCANFILSGSFAEAFGVNPYLFLLFLYGVVLTAVFHLAFLLRLKFAEKLLKAMVSPAAVTAIAIGFAVFGLVRNFV